MELIKRFDRISIHSKRCSDQSKVFDIMVHTINEKMEPCREDFTLLEAINLRDQLNEAIGLTKDLEKEESRK